MNPIKEELKLCSSLINPSQETTDDLILPSKEELLIENQDSKGKDLTPVTTTDKLIALSVPPIVEIRSAIKEELKFSTRT